MPVPTDCYFRLNGIILNQTGVRVYATGARYGQGMRIGRVKPHRAVEVSSTLGRDQPTKTIEFTFLGSGSAKWTEATTIMDILEDSENPVWTLESPQGMALPIYKEAVRAAFRTVSFEEDDERAVSKIKLTINALIEGIWVTDGGTYCEPIAGTMERTGANSYEDQDGTVWPVPSIRLPEQFTGYPLAVEEATDLESVPPLLYQESGYDADGNIQMYSIYDLTDYIHDALDEVGDVGVFEICSVPNDTFLGGETEPNAVPAGITEYDVARETVGFA